MEFEITSSFKTLPTEQELKSLFQNTTDILSIEKARWDVKLASTMSIDDFVSFSSRKASMIMCAVKTFTPEDLFIQKDSFDGIWETCTNNFEETLLERINQYLVRNKQLPEDDETKMYLSRDDSRLMLKYNEFIVQSNVSQYVKEIELYCEVNGRMYKLTKTADISDFLEDIREKIMKAHDSISQLVESIMNAPIEEEKPQEDDDEYAVDEPVENIFAPRENVENTEQEESEL